jgi:3alpha(or 20beta)-hydroxysteroid dehydrogenase
MGRLDGKVALISGAARGMGNAEARLFAAEGARVVVTDIVDDEGKTLAGEIGGSALFQHLDVTSEEEWNAAVSAATAAFGRLDILVNNAGIVIPSPMRDLLLEHYRAVTEVNQTGVFLGMKAATPAMEASGGGSIINISSIDGIIAMDMVFAYVASKFAVRGMTKAAAIELAPVGIRVNSIHPGFVHTQLGNLNPGDDTRQLLDDYSARRVPLGRTGEPEDIAPLALFLASDESAYCTGSEFVADGGILAGEPAPRGAE